jgi:hypothetical protein
LRQQLDSEASVYCTVSVEDLKGYCQACDITSPSVSTHNLTYQLHRAIRDQYTVSTMVLCSIQDLYGAEVNVCIEDGQASDTCTDTYFRSSNNLFDCYSAAGTWHEPYLKWEWSIHVNHVNLAHNLKKSFS